jgi:hypothetical protein
MKTRSQSAIFIFLIFLFCYGCKENQTEQTGSGDGAGAGYVTEMKIAPLVEEKAMLSDRAYAKAEASMDEYTPGMEVLPDKPSINKKKIIKDGRISVKAREITSSKKRLDEIMKKLNAYYDSEDLNNNDEMISYDLKIRVPAQYFEKLLTGIESGTDEIKSKSVEARDVTEEYIDIETRLINKREYLHRYKELLSRAGTVKDILAIEENIRVLQEEIESKEGRLKYLSDQISFSTLYVNLFQEKDFVYKPQPQDKYTERVKKSLENSWTSVVDFSLWIVSIWPHLIIISVAFVFIKRWNQNRKKKRSAK